MLSDHEMHLTYATAGRACMRHTSRVNYQLQWQCH